MKFSSCLRSTTADVSAFFFFYHKLVFFSVNKSHLELYTWTQCLLYRKVETDTFDDSNYVNYEDN